MKNKMKKKKSENNTLTIESRMHPVDKVNSKHSKSEITIKANVK